MEGREIGTPIEYQKQDGPPSGVSNKEQAEQETLKIIEDNGKIRLAEFADVDSLFDYWMESQGKNDRVPIIGYRRATEDDEDGKYFLGEPTINSTIEFCLELLNQRASDFKQWRRSIKEQGITSFNYLEGLKYHDIGDNLETFINPQLVRISGNSVVGGYGGDPVDTNAAIINLPKELTNLMKKKCTIVFSLASGQNEWYSKYFDLPDEEAFARFKDRISWTPETHFPRDLFNENPELEEDDEFEKFRAELIDIATNYLMYLDKVYADLDQFIQGVREYKTEGN